LLFLKLGGSLITDKIEEETARPKVMARLAAEVAEALASRPDMRLVLGHGSGSFGHVMGERYGTRLGVRTKAGWRGFALTAAAAQRLNRLVTTSFLNAGVPVWSLQPSASARCRDGQLTTLDYRPISQALEHGLVPLVYGDVALDEVRGGTIVSTEEIFVWLARLMKPNRIVLAGVVPGVMRPGTTAEGRPEVVRRITPEQMGDLHSVLGGSHGTDVTGGMTSKVQTMCALVEEAPWIEVRLISGEIPGLVRDVLIDRGLDSGTVIRAASARLTANNA
jgi:isopentenyl phosphate kinase